MKKIVIASSNLGKVAEIKSFQGLKGYEILTLQDFKGNWLPPKEIGKTYEENALQKAHYYYEKIGLPILGDDGGLELAAFPELLGLYTHRFFKTQIAKKQNQEILALYQGKKVSKEITLKASLAYYAGKYQQQIFSSELKGELSKPQGNLGYGFDEIFYLPSLKKTLGQLPEEVRNQYSPRIQNLKKLTYYLEKGGKKYDGLH